MKMISNVNKIIYNYVMSVVFNFFMSSYNVDYVINIIDYVKVTNDIEVYYYYEHVNILKLLTLKRLSLKQFIILQ